MINIGTNTARIMNTVEAIATNQRNMFLKLKLISDVSPRLRTMSDVVMLWLMMGVTKETNKFAALSGCINDNQICFVCIEDKSIVCHPARDITETAI